MISHNTLATLGIDVDRWAAPIIAACARNGINNDQREAMFLAQCAHESSGFRHLVESLNYSAERLRATWPNRFSEEDAAAMARDEVRIGERAYGGRMGNGPEGSGDGYKYRGRGIIQITGRETYGKCGAAIGLDLINHPELLTEPEAACESAGWYWSTHGCNELADAGDFEGVTKRINGGLNGLADRKAWLTRIYKAMGAQPAAPIEERSPPPLRQRKETSMGMIALPLLAQLLPQVLNLFSGRAQATIAEKTGADPALAAQFMQSMIAQVGHAVGVPVVDDKSATQAVGTLTALPSEELAAKTKALEAQALATLDAMLKAGDKASEWDQAMWKAQNEGRQVVSSIAIEEKKAGLWDMTKTLVLAGAAVSTLGSAILLVAIVVQSMAWVFYKDAKGIDPVLLALAGPLLTIAYQCWKDIIAYRFDGTKQSSEQSQAVNKMMAGRGPQ